MGAGEISCSGDYLDSSILKVKTTVSRVCGGSIWKPFRAVGVGLKSSAPLSKTQQERHPEPEKSNSHYRMTGIGIQAHGAQGVG